MYRMNWFSITNGGCAFKQAPLWGGAFLLVLAILGGASVHSRQGELASLVQENAVLKKRIALSSMEKVQESQRSSLRLPKEGLPESVALTQVAQELARLAAKQSLVLAEAQYSLQKDVDGGVDYYEVQMPLQGDYAALRAFVTEASTIPRVALLHLSFTRALIVDTQLAAQFQFRLYLPG